MCTAATYTTDSFYFGRNLDYEFSYGDEVAVTPRTYPFSLRCMGDFRTKYAMIGMAYVAGSTLSTMTPSMRRAWASQG